MGCFEWDALNRIIISAICSELTDFQRRSWSFQELKTQCNGCQTKAVLDTPRQMNIHKYKYFSAVVQTRGRDTQGCLEPQG